MVEVRREGFFERKTIVFSRRIAMKIKNKSSKGVLAKQKSAPHFASKRKTFSFLGKVKVNFSLLYSRNICFSKVKGKLFL